MVTYLLCFSLLHLLPLQLIPLHFFDFYFKTSLNNIKSRINSTYKIESIFDLGINVPKVAVEHIIKAYERFGISPSNSIRDDINGFANQAFPERNSFCY